MSEIKCLENYKRLKEMLQNGESGDAEYFSQKIGISTRSFFRLLNYLDKLNNMKPKFNKTSRRYYLD